MNHAVLGLPLTTAPGCSRSTPAKKWGSRMGRISILFSSFYSSLLSIPRVKLVVPNLLSSLLLGEPAGKGGGRHCVLVGEPGWDGWEWQGGRWLVQRGVCGCSSSQTAPCGVGAVHSALAGPRSGSPMHQLCTRVVVEGVRTSLGNR